MAENKIFKIVKILGLGLFGALLIFLAVKFPVSAIVQYPASASLVPGDITSSLILDNTIQGIDINKSTNASTTGFSVANFWATSTISLPTGSITGSFITDATITGADISGSASTSMLTINVANLNATSTIILPQNSITSYHINDGGILNVDVNASAAIAESKIAYDTTNGHAHNGTDSKLLSLTQARVSLTFGESVATGTPVYISETSAEIGKKPNISESGLAGDAFSVLARNDVAQCFNNPATTTLQQLQFSMRKDGAPTGTITVSLETSANGFPSGTQIASTTISESSLGATFATSTWNIGTTTINASTTMWVVFNSSTAQQDTNYPLVQGSSANLYSTCVSANSTPTIWSSDTNITLKIIGTEYRNAGYVYNASGNTATSSQNYVGFSKNSAVYGETDEVVVSGIVDTLAGLSPGWKYYVGNATGTISTAPGNYNVTAGRALSATQLLLP